VALTGGALSSPKPLKFEKKSRDHETIFLNHYDWLMDWARQHTQGVTEEAEDLVQDLYVRFVQMKSGPAFTDEDEIRAYLYSSLRNLFVSKKLRSGRDAVAGLLAVDFDSVEYAISAVDRSQLLNVRSDLAAICEYACIRRKTSRAASALILRYFLGYLSTEVMSLLKAKRSNIDSLIETARLEAKAYLNRPGVLRFLSRSERKPVSFPRYLPEQPEALFAELQRRIFYETEGICLPSDELQDRYLHADAASFTTQEIAHLASCRICLNLASRTLGLPDLLLRSFSEGEPPESAAPPPARNGEPGLKKLRRRLRETYEHRPKKLQIVVDGEVRGVQTITSASSNFQISLPPLSQPGFVEVLSEQGVGLLYFDLQEGSVDVPAPKVAAVDLSDGRQLSVSLTLTGGAPVVEVSYYDPLLETRVDAPPSADAPLVEGFEQNSSEIQKAPLGALAKSESWLTRFIEKLRLRRRWIIAIAVGLCLLIALGLSSRKTPVVPAQQPTAIAILGQSQERAQSALPPHGAVHQTFSLEIRSSEGRMIAVREIDSLRSADRPLQILRLRTPSGNVVASHSLNSTGKVRNYKPEKPGRTADARVSGPLEDVWQHPPDAADFEHLARDKGVLQLAELQDTYEISFQQPSATAKAAIVEGHLKIAVSTFRPVAETLRVQDGLDIREYEFKELRYDVLRPEQVRASDFIPDSYVYSPRHSASSLGTAHLVLQAIEILNQQPKDRQSAIDLVRGDNGYVEVTGVLPTHQEAQTLIESLRKLQNSDILKIDVHSSDEPSASQAPSRIEVTSPVAVDAERIPLESMLRDRRDARQGSSASDQNASIRQAAREILERSARVHRAAWTVSQLASKDFRGDELASMSDQDKRLWLSLIARPLSICHNELSAISSILDGDRPLSSFEEIEPISNTRELAIRADALRESANDLDRLLIAGFALSPEGSSAPVRPAELLEQLDRVRREESRLTFTVHRLQQAAP
jgi:DNA-directed RNA polymerase specialized sigma24 family protein